MAYKFLGAVWVNLLLTVYLSGVGFVALGETLFAVAVRRHERGCLSFVVSCLSLAVSLFVRMAA